MTINKFDDISSLFNGADTAFNLQVSNVNATLPDNRDLDIKVGGVSLFENTDYTVTGSSITFNEAPLAGDLFAGEYVDLNTYVDTSIADLVGSAPDTLNTLSELADALGDNENFSTTITDAVALKADQTALDTTNGDVSTNATAITNLENKVGQSLNTDDNVEFNRVKSDELLVDGGAASPTHIIKGARAGTLVSIDNESTATSAGLLINTASENANTSIIELKSNDASKFTVKGSGDVVVSNGDLDVSGTVTSDALEVRKDTLSTTNSLLKLTNAAGSTTDGVGITLEVANTSGAGGSVNVVRDGSNFKPYMTLNTSSSVSAAPSQRVRIDDTGIDVSGTVTSDGVAVDGNINLGDNNSIYLGDSNDLRIYHDGGSSLIRNTTGSLYIQDDDGHVYIRPKSGQDGLVAIADGAVTLHHSGNAKLETTSNGIDVSGTVTSDGLEVNSDGGINLTANTVGRTLIIKPSLTGAVHEFTSDNTAAGYSFSNSSSELMRLNSTGDLDVSGTVTSDGLTVNGTNADLVVGSTGNDITFTRNGDNYISAVGGTSSNLVLSANNRIAINTNGNEAARITSGGDLLVGTTSTTPSFGTGNGTAIRTGEMSHISRSGGTVLALNRASSDGTIIDLRKDGSTVGSLGVEFTDNMYIGGNSSHAKLGFGSTSIVPSNGNSTARDANTDLGASNNRFKDLHLSGTAYTGGLEVHNTTASDTVATFEGTYVGSGDVKLASFERSGGAVAAAVTYTDATTSMKFGTTTPHSLSLATDDTNRLTIGSTGDVSINSGNLDVSGDVTLASTAPLLHLENTTSGTGKTWRFSSASNGKLYITQEGVVDAVTLDHTTGDATLSGNLDVSGDITADSYIQANGNISTGSVGGRLRAGASNEVQLYFDGSHARLNNSVGNLILGSAGNVSISSGNLDVSGDITVGQLSSGQTANLVINNEGGNTAALEVLSRTNRSILKIADNDTTGYISAEGDLLSIGRNAGSNAANINIDSSNNVAIGGNLDVSGDIQTSTKLITKTTNGEVLRFERESDSLRYSSITANALDGGEAFISFKVHDGVSATSQTDVLHLKGDGNVSISSGNLDVSGDITTDGSLGVGTDSPNANLHISDTTAPRLRMSRTGVSKIWEQSIDSSGRLQFAHASSEGGTQTTHMQLDSSGNLDVSGDITTDGSLKAIEASSGVVARKAAFGPSQTSLHSFDLYNNGSTYLNGTVVTGGLLNVSSNLDVSGDVETDGGVIMTSPDGTRYKLTVANDGSLTTTAV